MKVSDCYYFEYSDDWPHFYCYIHNVVQIKGPARDSEWTAEFDMKQLLKAEGHISRNIGYIIISSSCRAASTDIPDPL